VQILTRYIEVMEEDNKKSKYGKGRDPETGYFLKGNDVSKGNKLPYVPRPTAHQEFKSIANLIIDGIPFEYVIEKMYQIQSPEMFMHVYSKLLEVCNNEKNAELKHQLELMKLEYDQGRNQTNNVIEIGFTDEDNTEE
jgi:hypothetical protein